MVLRLRYRWYSVMERAWAESPSDRPTFAQIRQELDEEFMPSSATYYYYSNL